jgi:hypothetical protein
LFFQPREHWRKPASEAAERRHEGQVSAEAPQQGPVYETVVGRKKQKTRALSSDVRSGSRKENTSKQKTRASVPIQSEL